MTTPTHTAAAAHTPWRMKRATKYQSELYYVYRTVKARHFHLEYASNGTAVLWGREQAEAAVLKANAALGARP